LSAHRDKTYFMKKGHFLRWLLSSRSRGSAISSFMLKAHADMPVVRNWHLKLPLAIHWLVSKKPLKIFGRLSFILCCAVMMVTCTKTELAPEGDHPLSEANLLGIYNYVLIDGEQIVNAPDSTFEITAGAAFTDSATGKVFPVDGVQVNSRVLHTGPEPGYNFSYSDTPGAYNEGLGLFGTQIKVTVTGISPADTLTQSIYMPARMFKSLSDMPLGGFDNNANLILNWTADPLNSSGKVIITIYYNASLSRFQSDSSLPATDTTLTLNVPDNGSYTVSAASLHAFAQKSLITFRMVRGEESSAVLPVSHKRVFFFTASAESLPPVYME
jgi:hypothetical protein